MGYLYGEALAQHTRELDAIEAKLREMNKNMKAEGDAEFFCDEDYPLWQAHTEAIQSLVEFHNVSLEAALAKYDMSEEQFHINVERLERGEGGSL